jgi:ABC-type glycerol-3-phosphate transport system permease component
MIEQIEFEPHGSWDLFTGALVACVLGSLALGVRGFLQAVFVILLIVPPIPLLRGRTTRMIGAGWVIGLLLMLVGYAVVVWLFRGQPFTLPVSAIEW